MSHHHLDGIIKLVLIFFYVAGTIWSWLFYLWSWLSSHEHRLNWVFWVTATNFLFKNNFAGFYLVIHKIRWIKYLQRQRRWFPRSMRFSWMWNYQFRVCDSQTLHLIIIAFSSFASFSGKNPGIFLLRTFTSNY